MKKKYVELIKLVVLTLIILFIIILITKLFNKEHTIKYNVNKYRVEENFYINNDIHHYDFVVSKKKNKYVFYNNNSFGKDKKIIKNIVSKNSGKTTCIMPIYKDNSNGNILCNYEGRVVTNYYLNDVNKDLYKKIVKEFNKDGYDISIKKDDNSYKYKKLKIYKNNIDKKETFTLWNYKGLFMINNNKTTYKKLLKDDKYENKLASVVGKYYVFIDTNNILKGFKLYYYDMEKDKLKDYTDKKKKIDDDIYFCGVYNNELYIYDKHNKKQYRFNPYKSKLKKVGDKVNGFYLVKNNKLENVDYYEFKEIIYFNNSISNDKLSKLYDSKDIYMIDNYYYIYSKDGCFYRVNKDNIKDGVLLFRLNKASYYIIKDNNIIVSRDDNLYRYNDDVGFVNIIKYNELKYNFENIYDYKIKN